MQEALELLFADFGVDVVIHGETIKGVLDVPTHPVHMGHHMAAARLPVLTCMSMDVLAVTKGDGIMVESTPYKVWGIEPDGTGLTRLVLQYAH